MNLEIWRLVYPPRQHIRILSYPPRQHIRILSYK